MVWVPSRVKEVPPTRTKWVSKGQLRPSSAKEMKRAFGRPPWVGCDCQLLDKATWALQGPPETGDGEKPLALPQAGKRARPQPQPCTLTLLAQRGQCGQQVPANVLQRREDGVQHLWSLSARCLFSSSDGVYTNVVVPLSSLPLLQFGCALKITKSRFFFSFLNVFLAVPHPLPPTLALPERCPPQELQRAVRHLN